VEGVGVTDKDNPRMKQARIVYAMIIAVLLALPIFASIGLAGESSAGQDRQKVPNSGGLSDLPKPIPQAVDTISRATEDIRKGIGKAASSGANAISIQGKDNKNK
jgi:hypothetical protein